jgi:hypothetical protein
MISGVIVVVLGLILTLHGYRMFGPRSGPNPSLDPKHLKAEKVFRVCGPIALLLGVGVLIDRLVNSAK